MKEFESFLVVFNDNVKTFGFKTKDEFINTVKSIVTSIFSSFVNLGKYHYIKKHLFFDINKKEMEFVSKNKGKKSYLEINNNKIKDYKIGNANELVIKEKNEYFTKLDHFDFIAIKKMNLVDI
ncbi:hypothetical protein A0H76_2862 [Hepatospora eriocheir]|uniref:Uncharacterized protein n=1 Tax=Hepatospora eriocheir TaxID=1081669 RepID=A0A1X0Q5C1_9MICR|nr:hypothetical protein A0H76_2862 [Hepatospora eriocheir]